MKAQRTPHPLVWPARAAALLLPVFLFLLSSCGGVGSGGTGLAPASVTDGTVNGFGSVIVDGQSYDDRNASVLRETAPGSDEIAQTKLGHRVSVQAESTGVARVVRIEAALAGAVASVDSANQLSMLGQAVHINNSGTAGPITQFGGGYRQLSDVQAGDAIEVHGLLVPQATSYLIQATRIDRLATAPAYLRATGIVSNAGSSFTLGALTVDASGATLLPAGSTPANGQTVTLLAPLTSLQTPSPGAWHVAAAQVRVQVLRESAQDRRLSGVLSGVNTDTKTFNLGGVGVNYNAATLSPTATTLANGQYAVVHGTAAADGTLSASSVSVRDAGSDTEASLKGTVSGYVALPRSFTVRGVSVDASTASIEGCTERGGLANGSFVELEGRISSTGVVAKSVHCEDPPTERIE